MHRNLRTLFFATSLAGLSIGLGATAFSADKGPAYQLGERLPQARVPVPASGFKEVKWDDLVPADWDPRQIFKGIDLRMLDDSDPRAMRALEKLREAWGNAPARADLNGNRVRIPGFVVPLERKGNQITEFLLVPYFGACIHTPPPPANQIIHVFASRPVRDTATMDAVWVNGTLEVARSETGMGNASYRLRAELVAPYREPGKSR
jgi:hypothetical protein